MNECSFVVAVVNIYCLFVRECLSREDLMTLPTRADVKSNSAILLFLKVCFSLCPSSIYYCL